MFTLINEDNQARLGILEINGRSAETPFFMPVATKAVGKFVSSEDYKNCNVKSLICNAFLISVTIGLETLKHSDGVHNFMNYDGIIFSDCGGFQMLREDLLLDTTANGILLKNPSGKDVFMRPEKLIEISDQIKSDVIMALDCVLPYGKTKEEYIEALEKSHRWTKKSKDLHNKKRLMFGITQGGTFEDLRVESAKFIDNLD